MRFESTLGQRLSVGARCCALVVLLGCGAGGAAAAHQRHEAPPPPPTDATGPPIDLLPWAPTAMPNAAELGRLGPLSPQGEPPPWPQFDPEPKIPLQPNQEKRLAPQSLNDSSERLNLLSFPSPFGRLSLVSRVVDQYGRIRDIDFLALDNPDSDWSMKVDLHHGAMLSITRRWGGIKPGSHAAQPSAQAASAQ